MSAETAGVQARRSRFSELLYLSRATLVSLAVTGSEILVLPALSTLIPKWLAFASVQVVATVVSFLLYKYWAFDARKRGALHVQGVRQILVFLGSWILNTGISSYLAYRIGWSTRIAFALSNVVVYLGWNYPLNRFWIFPHEITPPIVPESPPNARG